MAASVAPKPLYVFFDEVDCLGGETLITFLRQLRNGKIDMGKGVPFVSTVALIGMRDIRDYKAKIRPDSETLGSASPFNVVTEAMTLRSFTEVVRVTDEEAGIVNPRKDNWANGLSQVCNYFNQGGLTEHLRILVVAEDLELAKSVIVPAESRPLLRESRPNQKVLILGILAMSFAAVAWLATTYWSEPEAQGGSAERQSEGPQRIAVFSGGLDEEMAATICELSGKPDPQVLLFCAAGARVEPVKIWAEEPKVKVLRPNAHVYQFKRTNGAWVKDEFRGE